MIIEAVQGNINELEDLEVNEVTYEVVLLDHYDMAKPHQKVISEAGNSFAISLAEGEHLHPGDILLREEGRIVYVDALPEEVLSIRPADNLEWGRVAFNIGNMHKAAFLTEDRILTEYDPILEQTIRKLGIYCERTEERLEGVRAGAPAGHHHGHDHGHSHHHGG